MHWIKGLPFIAAYGQGPHSRPRPWIDYNYWESTVNRILTRMLLAVILLLSALIARGEPEGIQVTRTNGRDYFHLCFSLTPANSELTVPLSQRAPRYGGSNEYQFAEGGQFEVFVRNSMFPVPASYTDAELLILRMPWTNPDLPGADQYITEKRALFERIRNMKESGTGTVDVVIEFDPGDRFVKVLSTNPPKLEVLGRNIFFRQAYGRYISHVGPLSTKVLGAR